MNRTNTNLETEFNKLNKELFENELVLNFPLKWNKTKRSGGMVRSVVYRNGNHRVNSLYISDFYNMTSEEFRYVLAHEMIHVWIHQNNINDNNSHGIRFQSKMDHINNTYKTNIGLKFDSFNTNNPNGNKLLIAVIKTKTGIGISVYKETMIEKVKQVLDKVKKYNDLTYDLYFSAIPDFIVYPIKRSLKTLTTYNVEKDLLEKLFSENEKII